MTTTEAPPRIAVAIPCFNEAAAIASVINHWREAVPFAEIVVFDNNSNDGTGQIARDLGVRVIEVKDQGKGYAVRAAFAELGDRDALILVDGDGTYPAEYAPLLIGPVLEGDADMMVGARQPVVSSGAMSPLRGFGNVLIRSAFLVLIAWRAGDLLSGYRVFGPRFLKEVRPRSRGFEIETELTCEAATKHMRVREFTVPYLPRIAGTASKLRAFRDGCRILGTIAVQSLRYRPWRPLFLLLLVSLIVSLLFDFWIIAPIMGIGIVGVIIAYATRHAT